MAMIATDLAAAIHCFENTAMLVHSPQLLGKSVLRRCLADQSEVYRRKEEPEG